MVKITMSKVRDHYKIAVQGHTDTDLCNGISALLCTLHGCLRGDSEVQDLQARITPGDSLIVFNTDSTFAKACIGFVTIGFLMMEKNFPQKIIFKKSSIVRSLGGDFNIDI